MNKRLLNELDVYINYNKYLSNNTNYIYKNMANDVLDLEKNIYHIDYDGFNLLRIGIKVNNNSYCLILNFKDFYYPWVPPSIDLTYRNRDINFKYYLKNLWDSFRILFRNSNIKDFEKSSNCFCCKSKFYNDKWNPTMNTFTIIKKIIRDLNIKDKYKNMFILEKLDNKYNLINMDEIKQYLFK